MSICNVRRCIIVLLFATASSNGLCDKVHNEDICVYEGPRLFDGGEFSSDNAYWRELTKTPPDTELVIELFADGLLIEFERSSVGMVFLRQMGVWQLRGGDVSLYFASNTDWRKPAKVYHIAMIGENRNSAVPALIEGILPQGSSKLEILRKSFLQSKSAKDLEKNRARSLRQFLAQFDLDSGYEAEERP